MQLPAAAARRSQGQGQAEPAEEQHAEEQRAEGQLRRDRSGGEDTGGVRARLRVQQSTAWSIKGRGGILQQQECEAKA